MRRSVKSSGPDRVREVCEFFEGHGAQVYLDPDGENLIRAHPGGQGSPHHWQVMVQGWPNLVHELAHVLQAGSFGEDSGFEYHRVPLDLGDPIGRGYLWDELGACALSCAWSATGHSQAWIDAWFCEQVEILPVFFGDEANPQHFVHKVQACMSEHQAELQWAQARLWAMAHRLDKLEARAGVLEFPGQSTARDYLVKGPGGLAWNESMRPVDGPYCVSVLWNHYVERKRH